MPPPVYTIEHLREWARECGGECLSEAYRGTKEKYQWRCNKCGHEWQSCWINIRYNSSWCPECKISIGEAISRATFEECFPGHSFPKDRQEIGAELDGYNRDLNIAFEYDGIQHRQRVGHFQKEGEFEAQVARDRIKDQICVDRQITLIRIPDRLVLPIKNIRSFIRAELISIGYEVPDERDIPPAEDFYRSIRALQSSKADHIPRLKDLLPEDYDLVSTVCPTRIAPIQIVCDQGHSFESTFDNVERGRKCPQCSPNKKLESAEVEEKVRERGFLLEAQERRTDGSGKSRLYLTLRCGVPDHGLSECMWDNFKKGSGCPQCNRTRVGRQKRCGEEEIQARLQGQGLRLVAPYQTLNTPATFECLARGHRFTSTVKKIGMEKKTLPCLGCAAEGYLEEHEIECLTVITPEVDPVKTPLDWRCQKCQTKETTTWVSMQRRTAHKCKGKRCLFAET